MSTCLGLVAVLLSSPAALALHVRSPDTPGLPSLYPLTVLAMRQIKSRDSQIRGCGNLGVDSSKKSLQDAAAKLGAIDAIAGAMDLFPHDKELVTACTYALSGVILFNRANGLRAGKLGALNHTLYIYMKHMDDANVMGLGGAIGSYFDYVDENRQIARELGGIEAIIQNIRNHFHGKFSEWTYNPVKQSLFALSSGCWMNQDICFREGFPELAVSLMLEHGDEDKIAEETFQVTKALMARSEKYRERLADEGITDAMVHVLRVIPHNRGAVDLTCSNVAWLVGYPHELLLHRVALDRPEVQLDGLEFNRTIQSMALASGALEEIMNVYQPGNTLQHTEHGAFNFNIDEEYNFRRDCFAALHNLGIENPEAQRKMLQAGMAKVATQKKTSGERFAACDLLKELDSTASCTV